MNKKVRHLGHLPSKGSLDMLPTHSFIEDSKVLIFDLDGTLYEDTAHFDLFAEKLQKLVPHDQQENFQQDFQKVKNGTHPLAIGKVYDAQEDLIWTWDPFIETLTMPETWSGELHNQQDKHLKFPASSFDFDRWIAIGDGWWPPYVLARHYGVPMKTCHNAYNETKVDMAKGDGWITETPGLRDFLHKLKDDMKIVLMTNSDAVDVERLLEHLSLQHAFETKITSAVKPVRTKEHFEQIVNQYNVPPEKVISIGDNFMNEIAPALQMGMKAVWLTPDQPQQAHENLWPVTSLVDIIPKCSGKEE